MPNDLLAGQSSAPRDLLGGAPAQQTIPPSAQAAYDRAKEVYMHTEGTDAGFHEEFMRQAGEAGLLDAPQVPPQEDQSGFMQGVNTFATGANDALRAASNGLTLGLRDRLAGVVLGRGVEAEREMSEQARGRSPVLYTASEIGGSMLGLGKLAGAGVTAGRFLKAGAGLPARMTAGVVDGVVANEAMNAGYGRDFGENAGLAAVTGGAAPIIAGGAVRAGQKIRDIYKGARGIENTGLARREIGKALIRSGKSADEVVDSVTQAARDGQGEYALVDAMGDSGARALNSVARSPGMARTRIAEALTGRQTGQGERLGNFIAEGLDAPKSAAQTRTAMTNARTSAADINYGAARQNAGAVDVSGAVRVADDFIQPGVQRQLGIESGIADDGIESAVRKARSYLTDGKSVVSDFNQAFRAKQEIDNLIESASSSVRRQLIPIKNALDDALSQSSPEYASARNTFRQQSQAIDAIDEGMSAVSPRVRAEDTVQRFGAMSPDQQAGFRAGYSDPMLARIDAASMSTTTNKARPLLTGKASKELPVIAAPGRGDQMMRRINRENEMFQTANTVLGGSRTADNLADMADVASIDQTMIEQLLRGDLRGIAVRTGASAATSVTGKNEATRKAIANILLQRGPTQVKAELAQIRQMDISTAKKKEMVRRLLASAGVGAISTSSN